MTTSTAAGTGLIVIIVLSMIVLGVKVGLAILVGKIAQNKGYGFAGFFILGLFFFFIGLIIALCLSNKKEQVPNITNVINTPTESSDEILKLKKLLDENIITQEEFDAKKKQLLGI